MALLSVLYLSIMLSFACLFKYTSNLPAKTPSRDRPITSHCFIAYRRRNFLTSTSTTSVHNTHVASNTPSVHNR
jgi:hypothetical protein